MGDDRLHPHQGSGDGPYKRGLNTKLHVAVDKTGRPIRVIATEGTEPDSKRALELVDSIDANYVLADKAYDADEIIHSLAFRGIIPTIPPRINRKVQRPYDRAIYKKRHVVENTFLRMKEWRSISTRYSKNIRSFVALFHIRSISLLPTSI
jgi:transposase